HTLHGPTLLHFTSEQWKHILAGVKKLDKLGQRDTALEVSPMPGESGAVLAARIGKCPPDCDPVYIYEGDTPKNFRRILLSATAIVTPHRLHRPRSATSESVLGLEWARRIFLRLSA